MKPSDVARCLQQLCALYPSREVSPETFTAYAAMLSDLTIEQLQLAIERHTATSRYWPTVAELRALAVDAQVGAPAAELAWGEVTRAVGAVGRYRRPDWSHPAVAAAVEAIGGWQRICDDDSDGVLRAHFYRTYNATATKLTNDANFAGLPSVRAAERITAGEATTKLLRLVAGDPE